MNNQDFEKECEEYVERIAKELDEIVCGGSDIDDLQSELDDLEIDEPERDDYELQVDFDNAHADWENKIDELRERIEEAENNTLANYFDDYLSISYIVDGNKEYESVRVWVALGGPNVYVDTDKSAVVLNWGNTHKEHGLSYNTRDAIDEYFREIYELC